MKRFAASGYSRNKDSVQALQEAYEQALCSLRGEAHTAWILASHHHAKNLDKLNGKLSIPNVFAATAFGAITEHGESEDQPGLGLLLLSHPKLSLESQVLARDNATDNEVDWGRQFRDQMADTDAVWLFLNEKGWPESVAEGLSEVATRAVIAGGGLPGAWDTPRVLSGGQSQDPLAWAVGLKGATQVEWTLAQALAPLGDYMKISGSVGDRLQKLDSTTASLVVREKLGEELYQKFLRGDLGLYARIPGGESGRADRLFQINSLDAQGEGLFIPGLPEDAETMALAVHSGDAAKREFQVQLEHLAQRIENPVFGVYLNCCGRGQDLYGKLGVDAELFREAFPSVPLIGLSVGFELAPRQRGARLCSYTGILLLVS